MTVEWTHDHRAGLVELKVPVVGRPTYALRPLSETVQFTMRWDDFSAMFPDDNSHTDRVIEAERERDEARAARDVWKETAEKNDAVNAPLRSELRRVKGDVDLWISRHASAARALEHVAKSRADEDTADVAELRNVIVSQAREIARLKGESE